MRFSGGAIANGLAWAVIAGLACAAVLIANRLGFAALAGLGLASWLVCSLAEMDQDAPTYGVHVFRSRMGPPGSAEQRAAAAAERQRAVSPLRFYRWCGIVLAAVGAAGFAWQQTR